VLEEIDEIARGAGLSELTVIPTPHPSDLITLPLSHWRIYRDGDIALRDAVSVRLANTNYNDRVIFYCDRPM